MYEIKIDRNKCIGCGACTQIAEALFAMKDGKAVALEKTTNDDIVLEARDSCPVGAITAKEMESDEDEDTEE